MSKKIIGVTVGTPTSPAKIAERIKPVRTINGKKPDENGNVEMESLQGKPGADGKNGADGQTPYIKNGYWYIGDVNTNVKAQGIDGENGADGNDGVSVKSVVQTTSTSADGGANVVTVTLSDGTKSTFTVYNGNKGSAGKDGGDGKDGERGTGVLKVSTDLTSYTTTTGGKNPIKRMKLSTIMDEADVSEVLVGDIISRSYYLYHIYYLDATYAYMDTYTSIRGGTGAAGAAGKDGADGKTPVKGTDYWTDADKAEIKAYVDDAILGGAW